MRILIASMLLLSSICYGKVYIWKDDTGQIHYSDFPQQNSDIVKVQANSSTNSDKQEDKIDESLIQQEDHPITSAQCINSIENIKLKVGDIVKLNQKNYKKGLIEKSEFVTKSQHFKKFINLYNDTSRCLSSSDKELKFYRCMDYSIPNFFVCIKYLS